MPDRVRCTTQAQSMFAHWRPACARACWATRAAVLGARRGRSGGARSAYIQWRFGYGAAPQLHARSAARAQPGFARGRVWSRPSGVRPVALRVPPAARGATRDRQCSPGPRALAHTAALRLSGASVSAHNASLRPRQLRAPPLRPGCGVWDSARGPDSTLFHHSEPARAAGCLLVGGARRAAQLRARPRACGEGVDPPPQEAVSAPPCANARHSVAASTRV